MKIHLLFSFILLINICYCQQGNFKIMPYLNSITSISDGFVELGVQYYDNDEIDKTDNLRLFFRIPLTDKNKNLLQIDRFTSNLKIVGNYEYYLDGTTSTSKYFNNIYLSTQFEFSYDYFKYYPSGNQNEFLSEWNPSYSAELKYIYYYKSKGENKNKYSPQFRIRYSKDFIESEEVGVLDVNNSYPFPTYINLILEKPFSKTLLSPAFCFQYQPVSGRISFTPAFYYFFQGKKNDNDPFSNLERFKTEFWVFYYPKIENIPNIKMGVSPFLSIRTKGIDKFNKLEYGCLLSIKFNTTFTQFF